MQKTTGITFRVSDVEPVKEIQFKETSYKQAVENCVDAGLGLYQPLEACSKYHGTLLSEINNHAFVDCLRLAFQAHRPISISPDMIWLLIAHGFANHINENSEMFRHRFVSFEGKQEIVVWNDFVKGSPENPWPEALGQFSIEVCKHIGEKNYELLKPNFSTTGVNETAAIDVALMDTMKSYFVYINQFLCGIPTITLEGETSDWQNIESRLDGLATFGLEKWTNLLRPILKQFTAASSEEIDVNFWKSFCRYNEYSGGEAITGWINAFFPYVPDKKAQGLKPNPWIEQEPELLDEFLYPRDVPEIADLQEREKHRLRKYELDHLAPCSDDYPAGLSQVPFLWKILDKKYKMEFLGGFVGISQCPDTLCLRPEIGWAVRDQ